MQKPNWIEGHNHWNTKKLPGSTFVPTFRTPWVNSFWVGIAITFSVPVHRDVSGFGTRTENRWRQTFRKFQIFCFRGSQRFVVPLWRGPDSFDRVFVGQTDIQDLSIFAFLIVVVLLLLLLLSVVVAVVVLECKCEWLATFQLWLFVGLVQRWNVFDAKITKLISKLRLIISENWVTGKIEYKGLEK